MSSEGTDKENIDIEAAADDVADSGKGGGGARSETDGWSLNVNSWEGEFAADDVDEWEEGDEEADDVCEGYSFESNELDSKLTFVDSFGKELHGDRDDFRSWTWIEE